jgi:hypothetical protein
MEASLLCRALPKWLGPVSLTGPKVVGVFKNTIYFRRMQGTAFKGLLISSFLPIKLSSFSKIGMFELTTF